MKPENNHIRVLKEARRLIESGQCEFVCSAVENAAVAQNLPIEVATTITSRVTDSLGGDLNTVQDWLEERGIPRLKLTPKNMRTYRMRWIDWMIKGYEKQ